MRLHKNPVDARQGDHEICCMVLILVFIKVMPCLGHVREPIPYPMLTQLQVLCSVRRELHTIHQYLYAQIGVVRDASHPWQHPTYAHVREPPP